MKMQVTICGGGNAAHTLAGLLGSQPGLTVRIYVPLGDEADRWQEGIRLNGGITVHTPQGKILGCPSLVSRSPAAAVSGSKLVILALPAFAHQAILEEIAPCLASDAWVGALPARGGFDLAARAALGDLAGPVSIFGFQTLPWACRIQQYGREALILGAKAQVDIAAWPPTQAPVIAARLQQLLDVPLAQVASFLSLTLADTGQIIHPGIMYGLFHDWDGSPYSSRQPFYQGVDDAIARLLEQMSVEIQNLRSTLEKNYPGLDLSAVRRLSDWLLRSYRATISDPSTLQSCFTSNQSYAGLMAPMIPVDGGFVPDFKARYLAEDVPYNLLVTRGIAGLTGTPMPVVDRVLAWAQSVLGKKYLEDGSLQGPDLPATRAPQRFGFNRLDRLVQAMGYLPA